MFVPRSRTARALIVSDSWSAQADEILSARADLVLASVPYQLEAVGAILKAGVRFLGLAPRTLADIYGDIAAIAGVMGAWDRGQSVIANMQRDIHKIHQQTAAATSTPRVFCEEWGKPIIASEPWVAELVQAAGGEFLGAAGKTMTADEVAVAEPEVIVAAWCGAGDRVPLEKMAEQRGWSNLPAVRNGRVFCISDELLNTPATTVLAGLRALAWALHPEMFLQPPGIRQLARG